MSLRRALLASTASILVLGSAAASADPTPVTVAAPTSDPLTINGDGLCAASAVYPTADASNLTTNFNGNVNAFLEAHKADRVESVIQTLLDLSNNNDTGLKLSYGDFTNAMAPQCKFGGCDFFINDTTTSFVSRLRGFLNVTPDLAGKPIHFGFYVDDAVSLTIWDKAKIVPVMTRPPQLGLPTWRTTNTVTFQSPGLYPLEILYAEIAEHAALEMSYYLGDFKDYELPANSQGSTSLKAAGYTLFKPTQFFETLSGVNPFPDPKQCQQCDRQFVNIAGNNGCNSGYYCNEAALCAPCDTAKFCGPTCSPCGGKTPFCINEKGNFVCGNCRDDQDCLLQNSHHCDLSTHLCQECNTDDDCPRGKLCQDHTCKLCETAERCAGNSCNCCPVGSNGKQMQCEPIDDKNKPVCVECTADTDCPKGVCDVVSGHCVDKRPENDDNAHCGDDGVPCPSNAPYCIAGPVGTACAECRSDLDCADGKYCRSGSCEVCTTDRRCGPRCESCAGDKPFCFGAQLADTASCVRCTEDAQCGGGKCNRQNHECEPACAVTCAEETPFCFGDNKCVQCYAETQCPCGGTCDLQSHTCSKSCKDNGDCNGNEHCRWKDDAKSRECALGPMPDDAACGGTLASACGASIAGSRGEDPPAVGVLGLGLLALARRRRRQPS